MAASTAHRPCPGSGTPAFHYRGPDLHCEDVALATLAERHGTPLYVYSTGSMTERYRAVRAAFGPDAHVCFAVKSNSNLSVLRLFHGLGAGFDLVSGGELRRLQAAGVPTAAAVMAGVAKQAWEVDAAAGAGILLFNVESPHEIELLAAAGARAGRPLPVALRVNPDVRADTHAYIRTGDKASKFGVGLDRAGEAVQRIARSPHLVLRGYHVHLGSQLKTAEPYVQAFDRVVEFMAGAPERRDGVTHYDLGGGFGIGYGQGAPLDVAALAQAMRPGLERHRLRPIVEPGRFLVGDAGVLLTTVLGEKESAGRRFLLVDAAMNDLMRPALYQAEHPLAPLRDDGRPVRQVDVVGPVCESGDFLARERAVVELRAGERLAILAAGAYGASMASNYNSRPRPAEVLVDGARATLVRRRERLEDLWQQELAPDADGGTP